MERIEGPEPGRLPLRLRLLGNLLSSGPPASQVPESALAGPSADELPVPWHFVRWEWLLRWQRDAEMNVEFWCFGPRRYQ